MQLDIAPATPPPPVSGAASALGLPGAPALMLGLPQATTDAVFAALGAPSAPTSAAGAMGSVENMIAGADLLDPAVGTGAGVPGTSSQAVIDAVTETLLLSIEPAEMATPVGAAPTGSSLLAVLAGYVLPGSGGAPASTIVLFIVLGLILGLTYGAFPQMTERLALGNLMGASRGHGLAVRRPG